MSIGFSSVTVSRSDLLSRRRDYTLVSSYSKERNMVRPGDMMHILRDILHCAEIKFSPLGRSSAANRVEEIQGTHDLNAAMGLA